MRLLFFIFNLLVTPGIYAFDKENNEALEITNSGLYKISANLASFSIGAKPVDAALAFQYYRANKFVPVKKTNNEFINDGLINSEKWFALPLQNNTDQTITMVLEFIISGVNNVQCFTVNDIQKINSLPSSQNNNEQKLQGLLSNSVTFNISLGEKEHALLLVHTFNKGQLLYFPANLYSSDYFREKDVRKNDFFGIVKGIFLFIILFNLIIYLSTFDKIYLFYLIYAFFIGIFALNDAGAVSYKTGILKFTQYFSGQTFLFLGFSAWLLLMQLFISITKSNHITYKLLKLLAIVDVVFAFVPNLYMHYSTQEAKTIQIIFQFGVNILFATNLLFIIITNISRIANNNKLAIFYAVANIPVVLGTVIYYSNYYNMTDIQFGWLNPVALGLSMETFVLAFGFAYRFNLIGKEKRQLLLQINKQQHETIKQIIQTQESERKRIAEDLHDDLGSNLAAIKLSIQKLPVEKIEYLPVIHMLDEASADVRNISHNLMPPEFEKTKLEELLSHYYNQLSNEGNIKFQFLCTGYDHQFNKTGELMIYRIIMELTSNIIKHSAATESTVQLIYNDEHLEVMAEDNGKGIMQKEDTGIGLKNIRSRIDYFKGKMNIDTGSFGTTFIIQIPYKQ
ncbi:hypothetical protein BH10BAC2_BH10BAC2_09030 [soil metagenome]